MRISSLVWADAGWNEKMSDKTSKEITVTSFLRTIVVPPYFPGMKLIKWQY
jgi:hypothetical protein